MKQNKHQIKLKMKTNQIKRFSKAQESYEKMLQEIAPFTPRLKARELSTEGKWQSASTLSCYA